MSIKVSANDLPSCFRNKWLCFTLNISPILTLVTSLINVLTLFVSLSKVKCSCINLIVLLQPGCLYKLCRSLMICGTTSTHFSTFLPTSTFHSFLCFRCSFLLIILYYIWVSSYGFSSSFSMVFLDFLYFN